MNLLISAIAGDIGFGAGRILRRWQWPGLLHGIAMDDLHPGAVLFDFHSVAPGADQPGYLVWLEDYFKAHEIALFLPTSEAEIAMFNARKMTQINETRILINDSQSVSFSLDKFACMAFLGERGISVPENGIVGDTEPNSYPVILKPRFGRGGRGVRKANSKDEFRAVGAPGEVWQEHLQCDEEEYTCVVFRYRGSETRALVLRRTLANGVTSRGEVVLNRDIEGYIFAIAEALQVNGSINVQLRLTDRGPVLFEINPRLSSTLVFRDKLGFHDLRWWLRAVLGPKNTPPVAEYVPPPAGTLFFRGSAEHIVSPRKI